MHQGQRPRNLRDISHLYLSTSQEQDGKRAGSTALVLLASLEGGPLRAWLSAGLASEFGSSGISTILLETAPGLPCAGYYFALAPERYLRPVIEKDAVVEAEAGKKVKVVCARDPALLRSPDRPDDSDPRVIILAFDWPESAGEEGLRGLLDSVPFLKVQAVRESLQAFLLTVSDCSPGGTEGISRLFEELYPEGPALALFPGRTGEEPGKGIEPCPFPPDMLEGLNRRNPPVSDFLSGLAGEILQRLGSRKRGAARGKNG